MQKKWKVTATSPLGQESYDLIISKLEDDTYVAIGQENRGKVDLKGSIEDDNLLLSGYTEFPMRADLILELNSFDFNSPNIEGTLKIGNFCSILITGVNQ
jgi:hypothetical protein